MKKPSKKQLLEQREKNIIDNFKDVSKRIDEGSWASYGVNGRIEVDVEPTSWFYNYNREQVMIPNGWKDLSVVVEYQFTEGSPETRDEQGSPNEYYFNEKTIKVYVNRGDKWVKDDGAYREALIKMGFFNEHNLSDEVDADVHKKMMGPDEPSYGDPRSKRGGDLEFGGIDY